MRLILVRHGETEGQSSIRYFGRTDVPLSALGRRQMECVRAALNGETFVGVYASELSRAVEAAAIISGARVARIAGFNEIDFGDWEGLTAEEIETRDPHGYARWEASRADFTYPGGESTATLRSRVVRALHDVLATAPSGSLLVVVHKGVIRSILGELLPLDEPQWRGIAVALASIHVVSGSDGRSWRAEVLDRTDHL
jgi:broad specificity phosphatase PhoE